MRRRIIAWVLLLAFVLLVLNLLFFKVYMEFFSLVYIVIFVAYIFLQGRLAQPEDTDTNNGKSTNNTDTDDGTDKEIDSKKDNNNGSKELTSDELNPNSDN